ncbi:MAG: hypothetical protein IJX78_00185 [Bacilli bacterium]|nr:hypothetical protein [Bacilli bacterium]
MKYKILILMAVTLLIFTSYFMLPVKAEKEMGDKPLIIMEGDVDEDLFEKSGYVIISNTVNSNKVGEYEIVYQSLNSKELITRKVIVIDKNTKDYFNLESKIIKNFNDYPIILEQVRFIDENHQLLIVKYLTDANKNKSHVYMYVLNNKEIIKEVQLYYNVEIDINDVIIESDRFIITGKMWNSLYANYDIIFCCYDYNGLLIHNEKLGGSLDDEAYKIISSEDCYILIGKTSSVDKIFENNKKENNTFIMSLDKVSITPTNCTLGVKNIQNEHTVFINNNDKKYLIYQSDDETLEMIQIKENGEVIKKQSFKEDSPFNIRCIYIINDQIMLFKEEKDVYKTGLLDIKDGFSEKSSFKKEEFITCAVSNNQLTILEKIPDGTKITVLDEAGNKQFEKNIYQEVESNSSFQILNNQIYENNESNTWIKIHHFNYLKIASIGKTIYDDTNYHDHNILINGKKVNHSLLSIDTVNKELFGIYPVMYYFDDDLDLIISKEVLVPVKPGVENGEVYDLGVKLKLNATGYLNNQVIEDGYIIDEEGSYTLKLIGQGGLVEEFDFEVKKLSVSQNALEQIDNIEVYTKVLTTDVKNEELILKVVTLENTYGHVKNSFDFMYLVPTLLMMVSGFFIIKSKY